MSAAVTSKWRKGTGGPAGDECQLTTGGGKPGEGYPAVRTFSIVPEGGQGADLRTSEQDQAGGLTKIHGHDRGTFVASSAVRRLTPVECERLMSWPDGWTAIDGDATPDGRRYAACGDGVVSNVAEWIGRRIIAADHELKAAA